MRHKEATQVKVFKNAEAAIEKAAKAVAALEEEAVKALTGESRLDLSIIHQLILKKVALDQAKEEYQKILLANEAEEEMLAAKRQQIDKMLE